MYFKKNKSFKEKVKNRLENIRLKLLSGKVKSPKAFYKGQEITGASFKKLKYAAQNDYLRNKTAASRSKILVFVIILAFSILVVKAFYVQIIDNSFYQEKAKSNFVRPKEEPALRGKILDRNGVVLAMSVPSYNISIYVPNDEKDRAVAQRINQGKYEQLAKLLNLDLAYLNKIVNKKEKAEYTLKKSVPVDLYEKVKALKMWGIKSYRQQERQYHEGAHVSQLVGYMDDTKGTGLGGIEYRLEKELAGEPGSRRVKVNGRGEYVDDYEEAREPINGKDIVLSIDARMQAFAYQKLKEAVITHRAKKGSIVVLDAQTGETLAITNYPSFVHSDPWEKKKDNLKNSALTDLFEPGSAVKPITVAMAMDLGKISAKTKINTSPGTYNLNSRTISDIRNYGMLTTEGVLQKSSNVGSIKIGNMLTTEQMKSKYDALGFGNRPNLPYSGIPTGGLDWRYSKPSISFGYGMNASLFQIAHAYTAFTTDGRVLPPSLLKIDSKNPPKGTQVFKPKTSSEIRRMLGIVAGPGGTAQGANTQNYSVGGKTGTVRKQKEVWIDVKDKNGNVVKDEKGNPKKRKGLVGYLNDKHRAFFVGISPVLNPRVIIAVEIDEPKKDGYYGGVVAAPVFSSVAQYTLQHMGVKPDLISKEKKLAND